MFIFVHKLKNIYIIFVLIILINKIINKFIVHFLK